LARLDAALNPNPQETDMNIVTRAIKPVMLVSGIITCTMIYAAIAPEAALQSTFGEALSGPLAQLLVRNWAVLITLVGAMLIYGAFRPEVRNLVLLVASVSKIAFIGLVVGYGFSGSGAGIAIWLDAAFVILFATFLSNGTKTPATIEA
jgi:hypothetical protein